MDHNGDPAKHQIQPIDSLTPFLGGNWWIRARVTDKTDVRTWNKPESQGKLFSCTLIDESASIRATVFNDAVDVFDPLLVNGQVYYFSGAQVRNANRRFSNVNNDYELMFDRSSAIRPCRMDSAVNSLPTKRYNFVPIELLKQRAVNSMVDVLGVVLQVQDLAKIIQKSTGRELIKRTIKLGDMTAAVEVTMWNDEAKAWSYPEGTVVAMSQLKTGSYNGVTLSTTMQSNVEPNPSEIPDTKKLQVWYHSTGGGNVESLSSNFAPSNVASVRKYFDEIISEKMGRDKPEYVDVRCVPIYIKQDQQWYDACPTCNKKVTAEGATGQYYRCEKCDTGVTPTQRYLISLQVTDNVSQEWLTLFNDTGCEFFGMPAEELKQKSEMDPMIMTKLMQARMNRPVLLRLRVKIEEQNSMSMPSAEGERVRMTVVRMTEFMPIANVMEEHRQQLARNLKAECEDMLSCIEAYF